MHALLLGRPSSLRGLAGVRSLSAFMPGDMVIVRECARGGKAALIGPLAPAGRYATRRGVLLHADILGQHARDRVVAHASQASSRGTFMVHHPTLAEYAELSARARTPVYAKDAAAITAMLDVAPGDRVLEAGTGNGALTLYLARAVGPQGCVDTVERSAEASGHARRLVEGFGRGRLAPQVRFHVGAVDAVAHALAQAHLADHPPPPPPQPQPPENAKDNLLAPLFDGVVLDLPTPWAVLPHVYRVLRTDRYAVCYLPSMSQVIELVRACARWPLLVEDVVEVVWRRWDVRAAVVRNPEPAAAPDDGLPPMVCRPTHTPTGHTAFLVRLRKCAA
ncbi:hypothetical protein GGI15_003129 [Coemansia interrupta]|uniref:tRNA (adenine(58)-N(1))-methyltransferase catalytic subunit TRM61 n=1 Tax=Coemansia interrupta TaxID=1126814 RepID=A0A9W8HFZ1_9FUNG|nr:hypothetical protein GGI15_003129 [Coemansia interrupta]